MENLIFILFLLFSLVVNGQKIDWNNFSEEKMNVVMFSEMNRYVKSIAVIP